MMQLRIARNRVFLVTHDYKTQQFDLLLGFFFYFKLQSPFTIIL
jgi:hypothetical protein